MFEGLRKIFIEINTTRKDILVYHHGCLHFPDEILSIVKAAIYAYSHNLQMAFAQLGDEKQQFPSWNEYFETFCCETDGQWAAGEIRHFRHRQFEDEDLSLERIQKAMPESVQIGSIAVSGYLPIQDFFIRILCKPKAIVLERTADLMVKLELSGNYNAAFMQSPVGSTNLEDYYPPPFYVQYLSENSDMELPLFLLNPDLLALKHTKQSLEHLGYKTSVQAQVEELDPFQNNSSNGRSFNRLDLANRQVFGILIATRSELFLGTRLSSISILSKALHERPNSCLLFAEYPYRDVEGDPVEVRAPNRKCFVLGFPKCGTTSLDIMFKQLGYKSCHWNLRRHEYVGVKMYEAYYENKSLTHYLDDYDAFTQMDVTIPYKGIVFWPQLELYKLLYIQYPSALFILNVRDPDNHIKSIFNWKLGHRLMKADLFGLPSGQGGEEKLKDWIITHYDRIERFFHDKDNFIKFDIDDPDLTKFAAKLDISKESLRWSRTNMRLLNNHKAKRPLSSMLDCFERIQTLNKSGCGHSDYVALYIHISNNRISFIKESKKAAANVHLVIVKLLVQLMGRKKLPDCEFIIHTSQECQINYGFPIFAISKRKSDERNLHLLPFVKLCNTSIRYLHDPSKIDTDIPWIDRENKNYFAGDPEHPILSVAGFAVKYEIPIAGEAMDDLEIIKSHKYILLPEVNDNGLEIFRLLLTGSCLILMMDKHDPLQFEYAQYVLPGEHFIRVEYTEEEQPEAISTRIDNAIQEYDGEIIAHQGFLLAMELCSKNSIFDRMDGAIQNYLSDLETHEYCFDPEQISLKEEV